jgi:hypothetical protein
VTDYAVAVRALYAALGTWQRVADEVNPYLRTHYSRTYYWRIGRGTLVPSDDTAMAIDIVAHRVTHVTGHRTREDRFGLTCGRSIGERLRSEKIRRAATWDELLARSAEMLEEER